jgi:hypothetical protein
MKKTLFLILLFTSFCYSQNLNLRTGDGSVRIRALNSNGYVGIGSGTPLGLFHVQSGNMLTTNTYGYSGLKSDGTTAIKMLSMDASNEVAILNSGGSGIYMTPSGTTNRAFYIQDTTGYVSLGASTPLYQLHISDNYSSGETQVGIASRKSAYSAEVLFRDSVTTKFTLYKTTTNDFSIYNNATSEHAFQIEGTTGDVGIGTQTISHIDSALTVLGGLHTTRGAKIDLLTTTGTIAVTGTSTLTGAVTASSTLAVTGTTTLSDQLSISKSSSTTPTYAMGTNGSSGAVEYLAIGTVSTTDAVATVIKNIQMATESKLALDVTVYATKIGVVAASDTSGAMYVRHALYKRGSGAPTIIGAVSSPTTIESNTAWDVTFAANADNTSLDIKVTAAASITVAWKAIIRYYTVSSAAE